MAIKRPKPEEIVAKLRQFEGKRPPSTRQAYNSMAIVRRFC